MAKPKFAGEKETKYFPVGELRQSQLITTYSIGSIVDFVNDTVMITGIDDWDKNIDSRQKIFNENLQSITKVKYFLSPMVSNDSNFKKSNDVASVVFPKLLYCPKCKRLMLASDVLNKNSKKRNKCYLENEKTGSECGGTLVASRFVVVCENGHIDDFPFSWWIHRESECVKHPHLQMFNIDDRSDFESLVVKCLDCGKVKSLANILSINALSGEKGFPCRGYHPHLNRYDESCNKNLRVRLRASSSVYYPVTINALQIPPWSKKAVKKIEQCYDTLKYMGTNYKQYLAENVANSNITLVELLSAYEIVHKRKESSTVLSEKDIFLYEYRVLSQGKMVEDDYSADLVEIPKSFHQIFEIITLIDRLTVTEALKGFTRLRPYSNESERLVPLSKSRKDWLPAIELRGEGIFIRFKKQAIDHWLSKVGSRYDKMKKNYVESFLAYREEKLSEVYILLHSFAHLFIRQIANECGYSSASIREKIYYNLDSENEMHGVLIYLTSSDCDGSLGGLISIVQNTDRFENLLRNMIQKAQWCSADPLCSEATEQGSYSLNYAACHDCMLLPETSCELYNCLLDRISIVGTVENPDLGIINLLTVQGKI